jgi:multidrug resistance efflux pump
MSGWLLEHFWWGSVFVLTVPLAVVALVAALAFGPSGINETRGPVDHLGGVLSVLLVAALLLAINFAAVPNREVLTMGLTAAVVVAGSAFFIRQRWARAPVYDLQVAARRIFWVAASAGIIVFGTLMGAMFVGQLFLQNVLGDSTLDAGLAILPAALFMVLTAPYSARLVDTRGSRFTLLTGYAFCLLGFLTMLLLWTEGVPYWKVGLGYAFVGIGVGLAGTPASHSLTGSVLVDRAGMASGTADLQRDLGGAIMQSILGALLTFGYAAAFWTAIGVGPSAETEHVTNAVVQQLLKSFAGAVDIAHRYPRYASQIATTAKSSFLSGDQWAYAAGIGAILLGAVVVFCFFPKKAEEQRLLAEYVIGLRFVTPYSTNAKVIQHTIQLIPRLPEPTLVTQVCVEPNMPVKKGDKLFEFDRRPYEYKVNAIKAQLAAAEQHVLELKAQLEAATAAVAQARAQRNAAKAALEAASGATAEAKSKRQLAQDTFNITQLLHKDDAGAISKLRLDHDRQGLATADAAVNVAHANQEQARVAFQETAKAATQIALANEHKAYLAYTSQIDGENTTVALLKANLAEAQYYLDNTTMRAPEDGYLINLQVQPGMVAGIVRYGAIASFIVDQGRYVLATYNQENLKWVEPDQPVEIAFDLYPGQIFKGKVQSIWRGSGQGQLLPTGELPTFYPSPPNGPQGQFAVQIGLEEPDPSRFPIGAQGAAAIYTSEGGWAVLRRIGIRGRTWLNWLYPLNI